MTLKFDEKSNKGVIMTSQDFLNNMPTRADMMKNVDASLIGPSTIIKDKTEYTVFRPCSMSINDIRGVCSASILAIRPDSTKIGIIINNIRPFCIIQMPTQYINDKYSAVDYEYKAIPKFLTYVRERMSNANLQIEGEYTEMYEYHGFQLYMGPCIKLSFLKNFDRKKFIEIFSAEMPIFEDDGNFVHQFLRHNENIPDASWGAFKNGTLVQSRQRYFLPDRVEDEYSVSIDDIITLDDRDYPYKDFMMVNSWDIETQKTGLDMQIPTFNSNDVYIFAISSAINHWHSKQIAYCVVFSTLQLESYPTDDDGNIVEELVDKVTPIHVVCDNERDLIETYLKYIRSIGAEIEHAFNGGRFDYPLMRGRMNRYNNADLRNNITEDTMGNLFEDAYNYKTYRLPRDSFDYMFTERREMKTEAGMKYVAQHMPNVFGTTFLDSAFLCERAHPLMEVKSLNAYLSSAGLGYKEDMSYSLMYKKVRESETFDEEDVERRSPRSRLNVPIDLDHEIDLHKIIYYSYIDSLKLSWLFTTEGFVRTIRSEANLTRYNVCDAWNVSKGTMLINFLAMHAYASHRLFSGKYHREDSDTVNKFAGAYVVPPKYGLHSDRPITGVDFSSLYPSLMAAFNLSPDMVVDPKDVDYYKSLGYTVLELKIPYNVCEKPKDKKAKTKPKVLRSEICHACFIQHNGVIDDKQEYTVAHYEKTSTWKYVTERNAAGKVISEDLIFSMTYTDMSMTRKVYEMAAEAAREQGLTLDECEYKSTLKTVPGRKKLPGECMGVNARCGQILFFKRKVVKAPYERICLLIEAMDAAGKTSARWDTESGTSHEGAPMRTREDLIYIRDGLNSDQNAIKVAANSIYGKSGENGGYIFRLEVGAAIPFCGQHFATKPMIELVTDMGMDVCYGDTDSIYVKCPDHIYETFREQYAQARLEKFGTLEDPTDRDLNAEETKLRIDMLWAPMVNKTRKYIEYVTEVIADTLTFMNGTRYLLMAYEEVAFPTYLGGKKKYGLVPHIKDINFYPKKLMIRGFDFKKRGQCPVSRRIGEQVLMEMLKPYFSGDIIGLIKRTFENLIKNGTDNIDDFIIYKKYNTATKNVQVHGIVDRMKIRQEELTALGDFEQALLYTQPLSGETFPVIYVEKMRGYDYTGKRDAVLKAADIAEPEAIVRKYRDKYQINMVKYIDFMKGFLGRYIISEPVFAAGLPSKTMDMTDDDHYKICDKIRSEKAKKYIVSLFKTMTGNQDKIIGESAKYVKKLYKNVSTDSDMHAIMRLLLRVDMHDLHSMSVFENAFMRAVEHDIVVSTQYLRAMYRSDSDVKALALCRTMNGQARMRMDKLIQYNRTKLPFKEYRAIASVNGENIHKEILVMYHGAEYITSQHINVVRQFASHLELLRLRAFLDKELVMAVDLFSTSIREKKKLTLAKAGVFTKNFVNHKGGLDELLKISKFKADM